jgi:adenylate cyclase
MDDKKRIATAIKDHLARQRMSREQFAFNTKLGKSTVDKLLIGLFSDRTLAIVEDHTKLPLRKMVSDVRHPGATGAEAVATQRDNPSIAVLPLANLGGDPEQDYIADGLTEDIITALARLRWLFVIARNSTFVYRGRSVDIRDVARDLGVRYVIEGSVRSAGRRVRITAQLIEAETGKHIWAEKYDRNLQDIFEVQDDITARVVAAVEPHLYAQEGTRVASRPPDRVDVWGLAVRAMALINRVEHRQNEEAQHLLQRAIAMESSYARAHALLAWAVWWATLCYWISDRRAGYGRAFQHAGDALARDPADPWARMVSGLSFSTAGQHERALSDLRTALDLNPSFALGRMAHGWALLRAGDFDAAIAETGQALRLSPIDSFSGFYAAIHGLALLGAQRFTDALPHLRASVAAFSEYSGHYNTLISCCGHLGLLDEAREFIAARNRIGPPLRLSVLRENLAKFAHCGVFIEGLRKAGVPE